MGPRAPAAVGGPAPEVQREGLLEEEHRLVEVEEVVQEVVVLVHHPARPGGEVLVKGPGKRCPGSVG